MAEAVEPTIGMFLPEAKPDRAPVAAGGRHRRRWSTTTRAIRRVAAGEAFDPSPVEPRSAHRALQLANGMKVALLPKKTRGETAQIELRLDIGDSESLRNSSPVSGFTGSDARARHDEARPAGVRRRARQAAREARHRRRRRDRRASRATTVRASVPDVLRLAAEALREPAFAPSEFEQLKRERLTALEQSRTRSERRSRAARPRAPAIRIRPTTCATRRRSTRRSSASGDGRRGRQGVSREVLRRRRTPSSRSSATSTPRP